MVLMNDIKYACERCITGHRSSSCKHNDRPLFEIKKKGRPVTQCEHCRELRKTKQVHVKCMCESRKEPTPSTSAPTTGRKKSGTKIPDTPAFPNGLPAELLARQQPPTESSDSDHAVGCTCDQSGICNCSIPRKSAPRARVRAQAELNAADAKRKSAAASSSNSAATSKPGTPPDPAHVLARIAELRPVLPRPTGPVHDPSLGTSHRSHIHENIHFSPYSRAYEYLHGHDRNELFPAGHRLQAPLSSHDLYQPISSWYPPPSSDSNSSQALPFISTCTCGPNCTCPGCTEHNPHASIDTGHAYASCTQPNSCGGCLDCTIMSMPPNLLPRQPVPMEGVSSQSSIDDWIRQLPQSSSNSPASLSMPTLPPAFSLNQSSFDSSWDPSTLQPTILEPMQEPEVFVRAPTTPPPSPVMPDSWEMMTRTPLAGEKLLSGSAGHRRNDSSASGYLSASSDSSGFLAVPQLTGGRSRSSSTSSSSHSHSSSGRMLMPNQLAPHMSHMRSRSAGSSTGLSAAFEDAAFLSIPEIAVTGSRPSSSHSNMSAPASSMFSQPPGTDIPGLPRLQIPGSMDDHFSSPGSSLNGEYGLNQRYAAYTNQRQGGYPTSPRPPVSPQTAFSDSSFAASGGRYPSPFSPSPGGYVSPATEERFPSPTRRDEPPSGGW